MRLLMMMDLEGATKEDLDKVAAYLGTEYPQANIFVADAAVNVGYFLDEYRSLRKLAYGHDVDHVDHDHADNTDDTHTPEEQG